MANIIYFLCSKKCSHVHTKYIVVVVIIFIGVVGVIVVVAVVVDVITVDNLLQQLNHIDENKIDEKDDMHSTQSLSNREVDLFRE